MKLKKFYADNMQDAMRMIKEELGSDAVILSSKMVRSAKGFKGLFSKKVLEVLAGFEEKPAKEKERVRVQQLPLQFQVPVRSEGQGYSVQQAVVPDQQTLFSHPHRDYQTSLTKEKPSANEKALEESIDELRTLIGKFESTTLRQHSPEARFSKDVMVLYSRLLEQDVLQDLALELCAKAEQIIDSKEANPREVLYTLIVDMLGKAQLIEYAKFKQKLVMLIGPTGVGKTTTLVKLASQFVVEKGLNVGIINADVFRVAAKEHLQAYCEILGTEMITIYRPEEITDALAAFKDKDIVFLDTAGKVANDEAYRNEIRRMVRLGGIEDIYLTLSASTSDKVLRSILDNYAFLKKHAIIVTKTDEVETKGAVLNIASMSGRPLSYMTIGQSVPDDIAIVKPAEIANTLLGS